MDFRIFFSTFALIFMAELGDKTQLATMGAAAGSRSPISVFLGAMTALIVSSAVAVLAGMVFSKSMPERALKIIAGLVFLVFAVLYLRDGLLPKAPSPAASGQESVHFASIVHEFEEAEHVLFLEYAEQAADSALKALFLRIAAEEAGHLGTLQQHDFHVHLDVATDEDGMSIPDNKSVAAAVVGSGDIVLLENAIIHEERMVSFYAALAAKTHFPAMKKVLQGLAREEEHHTQQLKQFAEHFN